eukprot:3054793-Pleurochrysis_carterae.AAC.1
MPDPSDNGMLVVSAHCAWQLHRAISGRRRRKLDYSVSNMPHMRYIYGKHKALGSARADQSCIINHSQ